MTRVVLVDGVGRAKVEEIEGFGFLPTTIEIPLGTPRVDIAPDGARRVVNAITFERTVAKDQGLPVYRMVGVTGHPVIRRGYR